MRLLTSEPEEREGATGPEIGEDIHYPEPFFPGAEAAESGGPGHWKTLTEK